MEQEKILDLNHGDYIKARAVNIRQETTDGKKRKRMIFHPPKEKRTIREFIWESGENGINQKQIWVRNLARQLGMDTDYPDMDYLIEIEGLDRNKALKQLNEQYDKVLQEIFDGKNEVYLWLDVQTKDGRTYYNHQPMPPVTRDTAEDNDAFSAV